MSKVILLGICALKGDVIQQMKSVDAVKGKGLLNDRKLKENNDKKSQLTLIEIENINFYNKVSNSSIPPLSFRRNIITQDIQLNRLVNKEFLIGNVKVKGHDLCRPCRYLQKVLDQKNFVKELMFKGGLRCEILSSGKIFVNDIIKIYD
tara:strand:- start:2553 stop:2999 length:447 start_codon:yes stop_codon:yes gene_type:complete